MLPQTLEKKLVGLLKKRALEVVSLSNLLEGKLFVRENLIFMLLADYSDDQNILMIESNIAPLFRL